MRLWTDALLDTCSLVALGRVLSDHQGCRPAVCRVWGIEESLSPAWMRPATAARLRGVIRVCDLPPLPKLKRILADADLPPAVAVVDRLTFAAAVHHRHRVVTEDRTLARALARAGIRVKGIDAVLEGLQAVAET